MIFTPNTKVKIKSDWYNAGRKGVIVAEITLDQVWSGVVWDGDEDPDWFKTAGLENCD